METYVLVAQALRPWRAACSFRVIRRSQACKEDDMNERIVSELTNVLPCGRLENGTDGINPVLHGTVGGVDRC